MARRITLDKAIQGVDEYFLDLKKDIKQSRYYLVLGFPSSWIVKKNEDFVVGEQKIEGIDYKKVWIYIRNEEKTLDDLFKYGSQLIEDNNKIEKIKKEYQEKIEKLKETYQEKIQIQYQSIKEEEEKPEENDPISNDRDDDTENEEIESNYLDIEKENYERTLKSGMFFEMFPNLRGEWDLDKDNWLKIREEEYKL